MTTKPLKFKSAFVIPELGPPIIQDGFLIHCAHRAMVPMDFLREHLDPKNRNSHPSDQVDELVEQYKFQGIRHPIIVSTLSGIVKAGDGRFQAAERAGMTAFPVDFQPWDNEDQEYAFGIADNAIQAWSVLDLAGINLDLSSLDGMTLDIDRLAIRGFEIEMADKDAEANENDPDAVPAPAKKKAAVKPNEIYILGKHRLMCGDSTSPEAVARLLDGEQIDMVVTSPPYSNQRTYNIGDFDWLKLMNGVFDRIIENSKPETHILINLGPGHKDRAFDPYWDPWLAHAKEVGWPLFAWYVWDKGSGFPGHHNGRLAPSHEFVFHFNQKADQANKWIETNGSSLARGSKGARFRQKDGSMKALNNPETMGQPFKIPDSVIRITREMARGEHTANHPAVYPVEFAEFLIRSWEHTEAAVYEPFCGSGTTLIACQKIGRIRGFGMEIDPIYCGVILDRWAKYTGLDPHREDGIAWSEIKANLVS